MADVSEFVRKTLAFFFNCVVALTTLLGSSLRFRPIKGALRCLVRANLKPEETPDSRVVLFICSCLFGTVCSYSFHGVAAVVAAVGKVAVGAGELPKVALVTSVLVYSLCEFLILRATARADLPGRRGQRSRHILRSLVSLLLLQAMVYEPLAFIVLGKFFSISWFSLTGDPLSMIGDGVDLAFTLLRLIVLLPPFFYLWLAATQAKGLLSPSRGPQALGLLPLNLFAMLMLGSVATAVLYPKTPPELVTLRCQASLGETEDVVSVDARIRNYGDDYWTPAANFRVNLLGDPEVNPFTQESSRFRSYSQDWVPPAVGEGPAPLLVAPHQEVRFQRHVVIPKGYVDRGTDNACSLSTDRAPLGILQVLSSKLPEDKIQWLVVEPEDAKVGDLQFSAPATSTPPGPQSAQSSQKTK